MSNRRNGYQTRNNGRSVPVGKKGRTPEPQVDYRPINLCESEVDWLLKVADRNPRKFPKGMVKRLEELKVIFRDELLKLKELISRGKANSFYRDEITAVTGKKKGKDKPFAKQDYPEIAHLSPKQMKALLDKEASVNGTNKK